MDIALQETLVGATADSLQHASDESLIDAAKRHDNASIDALMRRYNRRLFRAARGILCDDAAAEDACRGVRAG